MGRPDTWFRMYAEVVDDPKVQQLPDKLFKIWVNLLCVATRSGGTLPSYDDVAFKLRITPEKAKEHVETFLKRALFDETEDGIVPHNWNARQYKSDVSTDRVKRFRNAVRNVSQAVSETPTEQSIAETETDTPIAPKGASVDFEKFWTAFPEKVGRKAALIAWERATDMPDLQTLLKSIDAYKRFKPSDRSWCSPAKWLRDGRWNDAPAASVSNSGGILADGEDTRWPLRLHGWNTSKFWKDDWGPPPDRPGCKVPARLLEISSAA